MKSGNLSAYTDLASHSGSIVKDAGGDAFLKIGIDLTDFLWHGEFAVEKTITDRFIYDALARTANEIISIHGVLSAGSYLGSLQHVRALSEVLMSVTYLLVDVAALKESGVLQKNEKLDVINQRESLEGKLAKYREYKDLHIYLHNLDLQKMIASGISDEDLKNREGTTRKRVAANIEAIDEARKKRWAYLFGVKPKELGRVQAWHSPYSISKLLKLVIGVGAGTPEMYALLCKLTHYSPFQFHFDGGHKSIGVTAGNARGALHDAEALVRSIFAAIDAKKVLPINLREKFKNYVSGPHR